jgi:adenylate kinase
MSPNHTQNRIAWLHGPAAQCQTPPERNERLWRLVLLGAPGVGKGTQADLLDQRLHACHLSTGDVFRAASSQPECDRSPAMREALEYMQRGDLVPDSTVWDMVRERKACIRCDEGFILDGFPRTLAQAKLLKQLMDNEGLLLTAAVNYHLPVDAIVARLAGRRTCEECKAVYHVTERPPQVAGGCDQCGGRLFQREDDRPESIQVRLKAYDESAAPVLHFYRQSGLLVEIEAKGSPEEICQRTIEEIEPRRLRGDAERLWAAVEKHSDF